tara:strand:+ start:106 stop:516 length:411 start_codon:yes stop_codon:yes gene_type:complete
MRLVLLIFVSFSLVLQVQGAASLLSDCLSLGEACKMDMPAGSTCGCEYAGNLNMLPITSGDCPYGCLNCKLEAHAPDILLSLPANSRTAVFNGALEAVVKMSVAEWSPELLDVLSDAEIEAPPPHSPMTEWGVWRL